MASSSNLPNLVEECWPVKHLPAFSVGILHFSLENYKKRLRAVYHDRKYTLFKYIK